METVKKKRKRRSSKPKIENHYKVLGVRSNSRPEKIKQHYIQLVKQYPPEQFPEEFERIRRAYETLRDPIKREEYNLMRKFGGSLEETMNQFMEYMNIGKWDQAEKLLTDILKVAPDFIGARLGLAQLSLMKEDLIQFEFHMQFLLDGEKTEEDQVAGLTLKARLLNEEDFSDEALDVIELLHREYPDYTDEYRSVEIQVYLAQDRSEDALKLFEQEVPPLDDQDPDHIFFFIAWINTMIDVEKWNLSDKLQKRVRKFLKMIQNEDDRFMVESALIHEFEAYFEAGYFRGALFYIDLLYYISPKHPFVLENRTNVQELSRIEKELDRQMGDNDLFPMVSIQAMTWFYGEFGQSEFVIEYKNSIPAAILQELESLDEEFAAGIKRLQKKYPLIYRRYKSKWDSLFEEKTAGLNREARRRLR